MTKDEMCKFYKPYIYRDGALYYRGPLKNISNNDIMKINNTYNTKNIMEAFYINEHGKSFCKICNRYPDFESFKKGYKATCKKCSHINTNSLRNVYINMLKMIDTNLYKIKLTHLKWIKEIYKNKEIYGLFKGYFSIFIEYHYYASTEDIIHKLYNIKKFSTGNNIEKYIEIYGEEIGRYKHSEWKLKHKGKSTLEYYIRKYGEEIGKKKYADRCKTCDSSSLEYYIRKYGKEIGLEKYDENCEFQKINATLEYQQKKYGEEEGLKKYNNFREKQIKDNNVTLEYYLSRGYSEPEAKKLQTERQTTFSKEICIEKYGEEKGLEVWQGRKDKWQNSLNAKPEEEIKNINKRKNPSFNWFKEYMNFNIDEAVHYLDNINKADFKEYTNIIFKLSNEVYENYKQEIDPDNLRGRTDKGLYHLDHKFSRLMGFILNVPPEVMSHKYNLEILSAKENISKSLKCSITIDELYKSYKKEKDE